MPFPARTLIRTMAFVAGTLALSASHAADPMPDAEFNGKEFYGSIYLDDKIKADALIAADCLAEGEKWVNARAKASLKQHPDLYPHFVRHYAVRSVVDDRYVSIVRSDVVSTYSAHPNRTVDTILWDEAINKRISIRPFFTETTDGGPTLKAIQEAIIASLKVEKNKRGFGAEFDPIKGWIEYIEPSLLNIGPLLAIAPSTETGKSSGLTFYYGVINTFVPWKTLQPFLSPEGIRIFGGDRPKSDEDDEQ